MATKMVRWMVLVLTVLVMMGATVPANAQQPQPKKYAMKGEIKSLDAKAKSAMIDAGKIEGWMEPMTMEYIVKPDADLAKLHVGDRIQATVVVKDPGFYVTDVKVK